MKTIIHSNGSKWAGEAPDGIDDLIKVLKLYTIEKRFFKCFSKLTKNGIKWYQLCPIHKSNDRSKTIFFGNFEEISHVFRIETDDKDVIKKLTKAIKNNKGWHKYFNKNLINNNK